MRSPSEEITNRLQELARLIAKRDIPRTSEEWGGAGVVVCNSPPDKLHDAGAFPRPRTVVTPNSRQLSWLFAELRDCFYANRLVDYSNKIEFFGRLANAALRYQARCQGPEETGLLLLAVLREAFAMLEELLEGNFHVLPVAIGNRIADDFIDREEHRGFIGVEETKRFFASRGVELQ